MARSSLLFALVLPVVLPVVTAATPSYADPPRPLPPPPSHVEPPHVVAPPPALAVIVKPAPPALVPATLHVSAAPAPQANAHAASTPTPSVVAGYQAYTTKERPKGDGLWLTRAHVEDRLKVTATYIAGEKEKVRGLEWDLVKAKATAAKVSEISASTRAWATQSNPYSPRPEDGQLHLDPYKEAAYHSAGAQEYEAHGKVEQLAKQIADLKLRITSTERSHDQHAAELAAHPEVTWFRGR